MALEYLVAASNEMFLELAGEMRVQPSTLARVAAIGCKTLRDLVVDREFVVSLVAVSNGRRQYAVQFDDITGRSKGSFEHFGYFFSIERKVMLEAGFHARFVESLMKEARQLITGIRNWDGDFQALLATTVRVRHQACQLATALEEEQERVSQRQETIRHVRRVAYAVAGGAIIVLNAAVPPPLNLAGAAVSAALGGHL